ncbi:alkylhydroperoxidase-related (seleno)protein [uncultured Microbulbifer sp.]|uniref:alkylhydroperoxidase-related (seleno)protein n=1 Tax=uncultured Microbulbifer sp. TaxID=348147 RepID=UPI002630FB3D|nr:alkylhydroperoxidase-related (seleno)protein [uncultured Microbulbifer sp.]
MLFDYSKSPYPIREDLRDANLKAWQFIGKTGSWWSAQQHLAIAQEVRAAYACAFCRERKKALSPYQVEGRHDSNSNLPEEVIDTIHRIVTDTSRLSEDWLKKILSADISIGQYVELVAVVVFLMNVDTFHRALGFALEELPALEFLGDDHPSQYMPKGLQEGAAWVPMIGQGQCAESEQDLYTDIPKPTNVLRALSLVPDAVRCQRYMENRYYFLPSQVMQVGENHDRALSRTEIELVATRVSMNNECFYCSASHAMLLQVSGEVQGKPQDITSLLSSEDSPGNGNAQVTGDNTALLAFVDAVMGEDIALVRSTREHLQSKHGSSALVDVAALIGSFERMNRIASATGIELDKEVDLLSQQAQSQLTLDTYAQATETTAGGKALGWLVGKVRPMLFKMVGKRAKDRT